MTPKDDPIIVEHPKTKSTSFKTSQGDPVLKRKKSQLPIESEAHHPGHSGKAMKKETDTFSNPDSVSLTFEDEAEIMKEPDTFSDPSSSSIPFKEGLEIKKEPGSHQK